MRVEDRTGVMQGKKVTPRIICICEDEDESKLIDKLGKIGGKVVGELCLADGYGEFYIDLKPVIAGRIPTTEPTDKTPETSELRPPITDDDLNITIRKIRQKLADRLNEKGNGAFVSRHEILGVLTEEWKKLIDTVQGGSVEDIADELADLAVGAILGCACICWTEKT